MPTLRERIRSYEIQCTCWEQGIRPGFRIVGDALLYDGQQDTAHFRGCPWVAAVNQVYEQERKREK